MSRYVVGTIAQLANNLTLNGVTLGQPELSVMTRVFAGHAFKQIGSIRKEGERGRPAAIWQIDTEVAAFFEITDPSTVSVSDDAAESVAA